MKWRNRKVAIKREVAITGRQQFVAIPPTNFYIYFMLLSLSHIEWYPSFIIAIMPVTSDAANNLHRVLFLLSYVSLFDSFA